MKELELELKKMLIEALDLEDISADDIDSVAPLFGEGLGLDSIDALEIGLEVQRRYGIQLDAEDEATREHFSSVANLALLVTSTRTKGAC